MAVLKSAEHVGQNNGEIDIVLLASIRRSTNPGTYMPLAQTDCQAVMRANCLAAGPGFMAAYGTCAAQDDSEFFVALHYPRHYSTLYWYQKTGLLRRSFRAALTSAKTRIEIIGIDARWCEQVMLCCVRELEPSLIVARDDAWNEAQRLALPKTVNSPLLTNLRGFLVKRPVSLFG